MRTRTTLNTDTFYAVKRNSVCITFHCGWDEMKFCFGRSLKKTAHSVKANQFCFNEINGCADVSFHMNLFRVVFRWYFITQNAISFLSKWKQWNNTHNEFYFGLYDANRNWSDTEMKIFHFTRNKISCKHIFRSEIYWTVKIIWWIKWTFLSVIKLNKLRLSNPSQIKKKTVKIRGHDLSILHLNITTLSSQINVLKVFFRLLDTKFYIICIK